MGDAASQSILLHSCCSCLWRCLRLMIDIHLIKSFGVDHSAAASKASPLLQEHAMPCVSHQCQSDEPTRSHDPNAAAAHGPHTPASRRINPGQVDSTGSARPQIFGCGIISPLTLTLMDQRNDLSSFGSARDSSPSPPKTPPQQQHKQSVMRY